MIFAQTEELWARHTNSPVNEHFSVRTCQNGNVSTGALKHAHIPAQLMRCHWRGRVELGASFVGQPREQQNRARRSVAYRHRFATASAACSSVSIAIFCASIMSPT